MMAACCIMAVLPVVAGRFHGYCFEWGGRETRAVGVLLLAGKCESVSRRRMSPHSSRQKCASSDIFPPKMCVELKMTL